MDIALTVLGVIFVGIMLTTALTFGFAILAFFVAIAFVTALLIALRETWRRWRFVKGAETHHTHTQRTIIEGEYLDITHIDKKEPL